MYVQNLFLQQHILPSGTSTYRRSEIYFLPRRIRFVLSLKTDPSSKKTSRIDLDRTNEQTQSNTTRIPNLLRSSHLSVRTKKCAIQKRATYVRTRCVVQNTYYVRRSRSLSLFQGASFSTRQTFFFVVYCHVRIHIEGRDDLLRFFVVVVVVVIVIAFFFTPIYLRNPLQDARASWNVGVDIDSGSIWETVLPEKIWSKLDW